MKKVRHLSKEIGLIQKKQIEIIVLKNRVTEMKLSV